MKKSTMLHAQRQTPLRQISSSRSPDGWSLNSQYIGSNRLFHFAQSSHEPPRVLDQLGKLLIARHRLGNPELQSLAALLETLDV